MKHRLSFLFAAIVLSASALAWASQEGQSSADDVDAGMEQEHQERTAAMEAAEAEISRDLKVAVLFDLELENGVDPVAKLEESGFILEVTREEAKAALDAAVATPDPEDDQRALELIHRGSFRFYLDLPGN